MMKIMKEDPQGLQYQSRLLAEDQEIMVQQVTVIDERREIGEWRDLIILNLHQIGLQILAIGELVVKKLDEVLVLWQVDKHLVEGEIVHLIPFNNHLQD